MVIAIRKWLRRRKRRRYASLCDIYELNRPSFTLLPKETEAVIRAIGRHGFDASLDIAIVRGDGLPRRVGHLFRKTERTIRYFDFVRARYVKHHRHLDLPIKVQIDSLLR